MSEQRHAALAIHPIAADEEGEHHELPRRRQIVRSMLEQEGIRTRQHARPLSRASLVRQNVAHGVRVRAGGDRSSP